jgi:outer membrane protein assembly factor BamB
MRYFSAAFLAIFFGAVAHAAAPLKFSDVAGWWCAEPSYGGDSSKVCLHFVEEKEKQTVRLSMLGIGGYDQPIGTVTLSGTTLDMQPYPFPLTYDAAKRTLSGHLPEAAVPVYKIPVEFHRVETLEKPLRPTWDLPRREATWTFDAKSAVWAGLERDAATGLLYVGTDAGTLFAIDANGRERWTFATGKPIKARPTVIGDALYVASDAGLLYKLDKRTGREAWRATIDTGSPERIPPTKEESRWDRYASSVVSDGARVYVGSRDKNLYAFDVASGREVWRVTTGDMITATPALHRDLVLVASFDGKVRALQTRDGKPRWSYDAKLPVAGDLLVADGRVFVGSRTYDLIALDAASGKEQWRHYYWFSWVESPAVVRDGVVYTGSSDATGVYAINVADGTRKWRTSVPGWAWARLAVTNDLVVASNVGYGAFPGVRSGGLIAIDRASGKPAWLFVPGLSQEGPSQDAIDKKREWGFAASPLIVEDAVYAADLDGHVYSIRLP